MTVAEMHPCCRNLLTCYEFFRRLGYPPEAIYVGVSEAGVASSILRLDGGRNYVIWCGEIAMAPNTFVDVWKSVAAAVRDGTVPKEELMELYGSSEIKRRATEVLSALVIKGMYPPTLAATQASPTGGYKQ